MAEFNPFIILQRQIPPRPSYVMEKSSQTAFSHNKNFPWSHCECYYYFTLTKTIHFQKINRFLGPKLACPQLIKIKVIMPVHYEDNSETGM